jgi:signal transduction histidine kinase
MNNNDETKTYFSNIETATQDTGKLARTILDQLEDMRTLKPANISLTPILERLRREFPPEKLRISVDGVIPAVMGHEKLFDALKELICNAIDHSDQDVKITLTVSRNEKYPWYVNLKVTDDGPGIMSENSERLFTPFFTTQGAVKSGLGLWSVFLLVSSLGGEVRVESEFGKGAEFTICLRCDK